jgi:hypothetical protein
VAETASYDVAGGTLASLYTSGPGGATCLTDDLLQPPWSEALGTPASGEGFYFIIRGENVCGFGTYGFATGGTERLPTADCP